MRLKYIFLLLFFYTSCFAQEAFPNRNKILYLMQVDETSSAFKLYRSDYETEETHDLALLQNMALLLLDKGHSSQDPEAKLLSCYGAGISLNEKSYHILENGLKSEMPELQLICLHLLSRFQSNRADEAMNHAINSNYLLIRLEAICLLAEKRYSTALGQTEALMSKLSHEFLFLFPQIYALIGDPSAMRMLRKLLAHPREEVRIETIVQVAKHLRDDLLPQIRMLATHHSVCEQEAAAFALGAMGDNYSLNILEKLSLSPNTFVRLAALISLYHLGKKEVRCDIEKLAVQGHPSAILALGEVDGGEQTLYSLIQHQNIQIRVNAAVALLEKRDPRVLPILEEILIRDSRDLVFLRGTTPGKALSFWKVIPSANQFFSESEQMHELSLNFREQVLIKALELPEESFLSLATKLFEKEQNDLIPKLVLLLENTRTEQTIALLHKERHRAGAPFIRNYCNLALYRLHEKGSHEEALKTWISKAQEHPLIKFRPLLPWNQQEENSKSQLNAEETSQLLIETFETFAKERDDRGINALLDAIQYGNSSNRYVLAGLLIRAAE